MSRNEAWFSKWLSNGKGSKKRQEAIASVGSKRRRGGGGAGGAGGGKRGRVNDGSSSKRRRLTAREKWGGEHPNKSAKSKRKVSKAIPENRATTDGRGSDDDHSKAAELKQTPKPVDTSLRQPGESISDFNARKDREASRIIAGEEFASTNRSAKSKKYRRLMEAKRRKLAEQKRRRAANYDSEEEEWMAAAGGRDDAKFGERIEDAPRFRNKLDESKAFSFLSKKKVVTLIGGSSAAADEGFEGGNGGSSKLSQKDQMLRLQAQVAEAYQNRK